ncbi:MAG: hypothetical protein AB2L13_01630 [Spirochaetota bacterium]
MFPIKRRYLAVFFILSLFTASFLITGCAGGDTATVTIRVGNQLAKADTPSVIDRIIALLSMSSRLQADPPGAYDIVQIELTVSGAGMDSIVKAIPTSTGELTLEIPSGPARVFTVVGLDSDFLRYMGGIVTRDIAPGENTTIPIQMGQLPGEPAIISITQMTNPQINIEVTTGTAYRIYRTAGFSSYPSDWGAYYPIGTTTTNVFIETSAIIGRYYRYRVSALNEYGESDIGGSSAGLDYYEYFHC